MKNILKVSALLLAATLAACGGGGGSGGESNSPYSIKLTTDKKQLPINIDPINNPAGMGAYRPFTTALYVSAETGGRPVPGGDDIFGCIVASGLDSGSLYYLDGDKEHEDDKGNPLSYRAITLGSNSGGASFHFHASNKAGTARITCSITDPRDKKIHEASVDITVGAATAKPAWVFGQSQSTVLGTSGNLSNLPNAVGIQASIFDDANQMVPNPSGANLQVSIRPVSAAANGAVLVSGNQKGGVIQVPSNGGVAQFSLRAGAAAGPILLEFVADRADNNVSNGIQDAVTSLLVVNAVHELVAKDPLELTSATIPDATLGVPYSFALEAKGGNAPYKWTVQGELPQGLSLSSSGLISGVPSANVARAYNFVLSVTDAVGQVVAKNLTITTVGSPTSNPLNITLSGCTSNMNTTCSLPGASSGEPYLYAFSATGGDPTKPIAWSFQPGGIWLVGSTSGNTGVISGIADPEKVPCGLYSLVVTASQGTLTTSRKVSVNLTGCVAPQPPVAPAPAP